MKTKKTNFKKIKRAIALFIALILTNLSFGQVIVPNFVDYTQIDPEWANENLGTCNTTISSIGCALTTGAEILATNGLNVNPSILNAWLIENGLFLHGNGDSGDCIMDYASLDNYPSTTIIFSGIEEYSIDRIKELIDLGNPVVVRVLNSSGNLHSITVYGYNNQGDTESDFLVSDPATSNLKYLNNYSTKYSIRVFENVHIKEINYGIQIYAGSSSSPQKVTIKFELEGIDQNFTVSNFGIGQTSYSSSYVSNKQSLGNNKYSFDYDLTSFGGIFQNQSYDLSFTINSENDFREVDQIYFQDINSFTDVAENDWYYFYIKNGVELGLFKGFETYFGGGNDMTREQMAKVVVEAALKLNLIEINLSTENGEFSDVSIIRWSYPYIQTLRNYGYIDNDDEFEPEAPIIVQDYAKILVNTFQLGYGNTSELNGGQIFGSKITINGTGDLSYLYLLSDIVVLKEDYLYSGNYLEVLAEGLLEMNSYDIMQDEIVIEGLNNVNRILMAKSIVNLYKYRFNNPINSKSKNIDLANYTVIGNNFELTSNSFGQEPTTLNLSYTISSGEVKELGYNSDFWQGEPMFFYWVLDNGNMTSLFDNHRKVEITAPIVTETTELHLYSLVGTANGKVGHVFITITVTPEQIEAPTVQASNIFFPTILDNSLDIRWTRGNGDYCVLTCTEYGTFPEHPIDNEIYNFGHDFQTAPIISEGSETKVMYVGTGDAIAGLSGFETGKTYVFNVFEYNANSNNTLTSYLTDNFAENNVVALNPNPLTVDFSWSPVTVVEGENINFLGLVHNFTDVEWSFDGANISSSTQQDVDNVVFTTEGEFNVTLSANNSNTGESQTYTKTITVLDVLDISPDLLIQSVSTNKTSIKPGSLFYSEYYIYNQGHDQADAGGIQMKIFLSSDNILSGDDTELYSGLIDGIVGLSGNTNTHQLTLPETTTFGTWYIIVQADANNLVTESDETNNTNYCEIVATNLPDFDLVSFEINGTTSYSSSETVSINYQINNIGAPGYSAKIDFYFSLDNTLDENDIKALNPPTWAITNGTLTTDNFEIPSDIPDGNYYLIAYVYLYQFSTVDAELSYDNNELSTLITINSPTQPTLQVQNIQMTSKMDNSVTLSWTNGNGDGRMIAINEHYIQYNDYMQYFYPTDGVQYNSTTDYTQASTYSSIKAIDAGNVNNIEISGLEIGKTYTFRIYEYKGSGASIDYLQSQSEQILIQIEEENNITQQKANVVTNSFWNGIYFSSELNGFALNYNSPSILKTTDGGSSWKVNDNFEKLTNFAFCNENYGLATSINNAKIMQTTNGGYSWENISSENTDTYGKIAFPNENNAFVATQFRDENGDFCGGGVTFTNDGGQTWQKQLLSESSLQAIFFLNNITGWIGGNNGVLYKTVDGGYTWALIVVPYEIRTEYISSICFFDQNNGFIKAANYIYKTQNGGISWELMHTFTYSDWGEGKIMFLEEQIGYCNSGNNIAKTINGGLTWTLINNPNNNSIKEIFIYQNTFWFSDQWSIYKNEFLGDSAYIEPIIFGKSNFCAPHQFYIDYTVIGEFEIDNKFQIELSDTNGDFYNPIILGEIISQNSGSILCNIPYGLQESDLYKIRITSTNPQTASIASNPFTINQTPIVEIINLQDMCYTNEPAFDLTSYGSPTGGIFTINENIITEIDPLILGIGTYTLTYTYSTGTCENSDTYTFQIAEPFEIVTSNLSNSTYCAGSEIDVNYTASGDYRTDNVFIVELSDKNGSFAKPVMLGNIESTSSGTINCSLPVTSEQGSSYKIRVIATEPNTTGSLSSQFTINEAVTPSVTISANETEICEEEEITFNANPTNGGSAVYQWKLNGNNVGTNSSSFSYNNFSNNDIVSVQMTSDASCVYPQNANSNNIQITVNELVNPYVELYTSSIIGCENETFEFSAFATNQGENPVYSWTVNGNAVGGNSEYLSTILTENSVVEVQLISDATCLISDTASSNLSMTILQPPTAGFDFETNELTVLFENTSQNATEYLWNFGDENTSIEINPNHTYLEAGSYTVNLTASNEFCNDDEFLSSVTVTITSIEDINGGLITIYPNPTNGILVVKSSKSKIDRLFITDITGKIIIDKSNIDKTFETDLTGFANGVYLINIVTDNETIATKIIKN